tara:strand:- start:626 stop:835 length:210 start_codon:yes stop_codon:yes gene_type:complete
MVHQTPRFISYICKSKITPVQRGFLFELSKLKPIGFIRMMVGRFKEGNNEKDALEYCEKNFRGKDDIHK